MITFDFKRHIHKVKYLEITRFAIVISAQSVNETHFDSEIAEIIEEKMNGESYENTMRNIQAFYNGVVPTRSLLNYSGPVPSHFLAVYMIEYEYPSFPVPDADPYKTNWFLYYSLFHDHQHYEESLESALVNQVHRS